MDKDDRGASNYDNIRASDRKVKYSRSEYEHGKQNKARGLRRVADRHSHHRRRQHLNEELIKVVDTDFDYEPVLQHSTTTPIHRKHISDPILAGSGDHGCTNRKN